MSYFAAPVLWLSGLLLLALAACTSNEPAQSAQNSVRDQRLHALMVGALDEELARLEALAFDLHLTPTELDVVRERRARNIAASAARLRDGAADVLALQPGLALAEGDAMRFAALARQLQDTAALLEQQASTGQLRELAPGLRALRSTCNSCHNLYRGR